MTSRLSEYRLFLGEFWRNFHTTGAILPSGRRLSAALARYVGQDGKVGAAQRVLEVGPGTGAVTRYIVRALGPEDRLDLVELNANFAERLQAGASGSTPSFGRSARVPGCSRPQSRTSPERRNTT